MAAQTAISWADSTANFWVGCQKVSPACDNCYAEELMDTRYGRVEWGPHGERQRIKQGWADIAKWNRLAERHGGLDPDLGRRRRVFINSLSDFFDNHRSVVWRDEAWELIRHSPHIIFMLVTKRPQLINAMLPPFWSEIAERVWLLTTVENQEEANRRVPHLLASCVYIARPAVFGLSCEPLLGPINLREITLRRDGQLPNELSRTLGDYIRPLSGNFTDSPKVGWLIVGGESGSEARPMHPDWLVSLQKQCEAVAVPFHFKQWGEFEADQIWQEDARSLTIPIGEVTFKRSGKAKAGRKLFGVEHLEFPSAG